jgi:hypothetical protein
LADRTGPPTATRVRTSAAASARSGSLKGKRRGFKLELNSGELLELMRTLVPLYCALWEDKGSLWGRSTNVKMETGLAAFPKLVQNELEEFLYSQPSRSTTRPPAS